jgi:hypothetical protein
MAAALQIFIKPKQLKMKRILFMLTMAISFSANAQNITTVNTVKPKPGQKMAWEAAYKVHVGKFHKPGEAVAVYEILTGEHMGRYHIVADGRSMADFDKERVDAVAHNTDLDKTYFPLLGETQNASFRLLDSLSLRRDVPADKFYVAVRYLKRSVSQSDLRREMARTVKVDKNLRSMDYLSYTVFDQMWDATQPVIVQIWGLKDGFKSMEPNYYGPTQPGNTMFRDEYVKQFGHAAWDARVKAMDETNEKVDLYLMKLRKDLSTQ